MNTKEKILNESLKLFAKKGYDAVGVSEIADAVKIKAPSLYKHYKSKREIFETIIERVNMADAENAKAYDMPLESIEKDGKSYLNLSPDKMKDFTRAMFLHWTKDEFFCNFRKLLTLEQYKDKKAEELFKQYISKCPTDYMSDIFANLTGSRNTAYALAIEYYGPMYLMYSLYDEGVALDGLIKILDNHIEKFCRKLEKGD